MQSSSSPAERRLLLLVAISFFMQTLDGTIVNTALPAMARSLQESPLRMQSVIVAYSLTMAVLIPASGWLADRFGTKRVFIVAISLFTCGSLLCALAPQTSWLVAARVVQGLGGAMLLPVGRLAVLRAFPRERFLPAMNFVTIPGLIGPLIGPTLGGWLTEVASWHWIFLINIPIGLVGCVAAFFFMSDSREAEVGPFDRVGFVLLSLSMVCLSIALNGLGELGLQKAAVLVLLIFGLAFLVAYWLHAGRRERPLFPFALFSIESYRVGVLGNLFARIGSGAMPFLIPLFLQVCLAYSPLEAGLSMLPVAIAALIAKRLIVPLIDRFGYRQILVTNTALLGVVMASFMFLGENEATALRVLQLAIFGTLNSWQFTAMNTVTLKDLTGPLTSSGNSLLSMVMMLAMGLGAAAGGALLNGFAEIFQTPSSSAAAAEAFHATFICVGILTSASAWIFWQLSPDLKRAEGDKEALELEA